MISKDYFLNIVTTDLVDKFKNISHSKVHHIMSNLSCKIVLPGIFFCYDNPDEFKATKDTDGEIAFIIANNKTGNIFE